MIALTDITQLDELDMISKNKKVFLIKHSTRCGISHAAMEHVMNFVKSHSSIHFYYLDLLNHRPISNHIAERYAIPHSSPQVLVIQDGRSLRHATHYAIDERWLQKAKY